eukprot:Rmarinus@m.29642
MSEGTVYDDAAAFYVSTAVVGLVLVPVTFYQLHAIFSYSPRPIGDCTCESCKRRRKDQAKDTPTLSKLMFSFKGVLLCVFWALWIWLILETATITTGGGGLFNPFEILGIDEDSTEGEIKKKYRELSLLYHPDKNPNNPTAEAKFIQIAKAYEALTDEVTRANYEKYGSPDGPQPVSVAIGLPSFLLEKDNWKVVVYTYMFLLAICLPCGIYYYYYNVSKKQGGIEIQTLQFYTFYMPKKNNVKGMLEILSSAAEFINLPRNPQDGAFFKKLFDGLPEIRRPPKSSKIKHDSLVKARNLVWSHFSRDLLSVPLPPALEKDKMFIMENMQQLVECLINICLTHPQRMRGASFTDQLLSMLTIRQMLCQGLWSTASPLFQLPHITEGIVDRCRKGKRNVYKPVLNCQQLRALPGHVRSQVLSDLGESEIRDIECVLNQMPRLKVKVWGEVEGENPDDLELYGGDLVLINIDFTMLTANEEAEENEKAVAAEAKAKSAVKSENDKKNSGRKPSSQQGQTKEKEVHQFLDSLLEDADDVVLIGKESALESSGETASKDGGEQVALSGGLRRSTDSDSDAESDASEPGESEPMSDDDVSCPVLKQKYLLAERKREKKDV